VVCYAIIETSGVSENAFLSPSATRSACGRLSPEQKPSAEREQNAERLNGVMSQS